MKTKLSRAAKIIYRARDLGFSLAAKIIGAYFLLFLIGVVRIKLAVAGMVILIGRTWDYLTAWWYTRRHPKSTAVKSVLALSEMAKALLARGYEWADLSLTSADNPRTPALAERNGTKIYKRYRVFRLTL